MGSIGERLREERERTGLIQAAFAERAGVAKTTQFNYEKDERAPDALYLAAIAALGIDVLYILTGERNPAIKRQRTTTSHERLRGERERLGLSQAAFAEIGGVKANAQGNYEKGERQPDLSYLAAIAEAGADVLYIITGEPAAPQAGALTEAESALLVRYRSATPLGRAALDAVSLALRVPAQ